MRGAQAARRLCRHRYISDQRTAATITSGNRNPICPEEDEPVACPITWSKPEEPRDPLVSEPVLAPPIPCPAPSVWLAPWAPGAPPLRPRPAARTAGVGAVAAASEAAARPAGPFASSRCAFLPPRTLAGERLPRFCVGELPPAVGNVCVYWLTAEFPGGITVCAAAVEGAPTRETTATSPSPSFALRIPLSTGRMANY